MHAMTDVLERSTLQRWRQLPISFITEILRDPETNKPFQLLDVQKQFFTHAWQLNDDGRLTYPEQCFGAPKKTGKTATAAMHVLTTTCLFGGRWAEAYCVANDLEQAQGRVFQAVRRIVEASPYLKREAEITQTRISFPQTGAVIQVIGSDYAGAAGANPTISSFDELWASAAGAFGMKWCPARCVRSAAAWSLLMPGLKATATYCTSCTNVAFNNNKLDQAFTPAMVC
jgi:Phage Terminase